MTMPLGLSTRTTVLEGMTKGEMFRWFRGRYGRCVSRVYADVDGETMQVGWCFQKRERYEDTGETFLHETWITLPEQDETVRTVVYHPIGG